MNPFQKLPALFYLNNSVIAVSRQLLGKYLCTEKDGVFTAGIITETEAYAGVNDMASHARSGRKTKRNEVMYEAGGCAYVFVCYGIHCLFNVVTGKKDDPVAILIRAVEPVAGINEMLRRRKKDKIDKTLTAGPGLLTQALGIDISDNGCSLTGNKVYLAESKIKLKNSEIECTTRIGVNYAGSDALRPYKLYIKGNRFVSRY